MPPARSTAAHASTVRRRSTGSQGGSPSSRSAPSRQAPRSRSARSRLAPRRRGSGGIRWDRVGRTALLLLLGVIVLLYIPPVTHWIEQRQTSGHQQAELQQLQRENEELEQRVDSLTGPDAIEREARGLGMVREGEQAIVVEGLPEE